MNIGVVIIARIASTRLNKKMLLRAGDETFIEQVINIAKTRFRGPIIFDTTPSSEDTILAAMARKKGLPVVRGHESDILLSYLKVAQKHKLDGIITWDGDDLFVSALCLQKTKQLLQRGADYVMPKDLAYGTFSYGIGTKALKKVVRLKNDKDTQGWGRYFTQIPGFKLATYQIPKYAPLSRLRLTLDYPEDYVLIKKIFDFINSRKKLRSEVFDEIALFAKKYPRDCKINHNRIEEYQKRWDKKYSKIYLKK